MQARDRFPMRLVVILLALALVLAGGTTVYSVIAADRITGQQTVVMAPEVLRPGDATLIRAVVQDFNTGKPIPNAAVTMRLEPTDGSKAVTLYEGKTDENGRVDALVSAPEEATPAQELVVETRSRFGSSKLTRAVQVRRDAKLLLTTDKPLYQPGQTIHIRCLALDVSALTPMSAQDVTFIIEDPRGNKVHRSSVPASEWGIGSLDFVLASEVNQGLYKVTAQIGETLSEKTVTVKPYVLPKFGIKVQTDRDFYKPGQTVEGSLQATYFFGKPVSEGQVEIVGYLREIEQREVVRLQGTTDAQGGFEFSFELPTYFVGGIVELGKATLGLEITVIDQADHAEATAHSLPIAMDTILIDAVPESGQLELGVENIIYILTTYPDGSPAQANLEMEVGGETVKLQTGEFGLATYTLVPTDRNTSLTILARDAQGNWSSNAIDLPWQRADEYVLLRPERAAYRVGDTLHVDILASADQGTAYLDIIRAGQTLSTRAIDISDGLASADVDLDQTLFGTLQLHAYKVLRDATIVGDTRLVVVDRASDIAVDISADKDTYRPGDVARLLFETSANGQPVSAALGVSIVDESVFALQEQEAGFAKLFFLLQAEILKPRYQLKWFQPAAMLTPTTAEPAIQEAQDQTAKAVMASVDEAGPAALTEPRAQKQRAIQAEQQDVFLRTADRLSWAVIALSALGLIASIVALIRRKTIGKSLGYGALLLLGLIGLAAVLLVPLYVSDLLWRAEDLIGLLALGLVAISVLALIVYGIIALRRRDRALQTIFLVLLTCLVMIVLVGFTAYRVRPYSWEGLIVQQLAALSLILLAIYLHGMSTSVEGNRARGAVGIVAGGFGLLPMLVVVFAAMAMGQAPASGDFEAITDAMAVELAAPGRGIGRMVFETVVVEREMRGAALQATPEMAVRAKAGEPAEGQSSASQEPPRLRQFFPETMYWNPQVLTDETGKTELEVPVADSITTWRLSALASSQGGQLGNADVGLRVFQDFFIDLDLPLYLTQNDQVSLPVAVFNYLPTAQEVRLVVQEEPWFELLDDVEKTMTIASNDIDVVYFRIRAKEFGMGRFQVTAWGEKMSDAIVKEVRVMPDGKDYRASESDNLRESLARTVMIPEVAIPGTPKVWVKLYPGIVSQIVEGLSGLLRMPFG